MSIAKETKYYCTNCKKEFWSEYDFSLNLHKNYTNEQNLNIDISNFHGGQKDTVFFNSFCKKDITDLSYEQIMEIFECRLLWFKNHGHEEISNYLESRRPDIIIEYNKNIQSKINQIDKQINKLQDEKEKLKSEIIDTGENK